MIHEMTLHKSPFLAIQSGQKTIEMRLYDERRQGIQGGDFILFKMRDDESQTLLCEVKALHLFPTFGDLYAHFPLSALGYTKEEETTASPEDMGQYYTKEQQDAYGVVGIEIALCTQ